MAGAKERSYRDFNRDAWTYLARQGEESTVPYGPSEFEDPYTFLDPESWIPWPEIGTVLCLASGGGQQGPLFASLGLTVTVVDLSAKQLESDRATAKRYGFTIECIEGDMMDLSALYGRKYDLVYQPISAHYVPDVRHLYREIFRVLRPGGYYFVEHWNPVQMQLAESRPWDGGGYRIVHPQGTDEPLAWEHSTGNGESAISWNYIHSIEALVGGMCDAGFVVLRFGERHDGDLSAKPGSNEHMSAYIPSFLSTFARRPRTRG